MATVRYFWHGFIHRGTTFTYLQYSHPFIYYFCQTFGRRHTQSACPSLLMFSIDRPIARIISCVVPGPSECSFTLTMRPPHRNNIVTHRAAGRVRLAVGSLSWLRFFPEFSLNHKTNVKEFGPHSSPVIMWPSYNNIQTMYHPSSDSDGLWP